MTSVRLEDALAQQLPCLTPDKAGELAGMLPRLIAALAPEAIATVYAAAVLTMTSRAPGKRIDRSASNASSRRAFLASSDASSDSLKASWCSRPNSTKTPTSSKPRYRL